MQACVDWVLKIFGTQVIKKKRPVRPVFPDYLSVSYDYGYFYKKLRKHKHSYGKRNYWNKNLNPVNVNLTSQTWKRKKQSPGGVLYEKVFLEISQNSQESTCARVSFLIIF